MAEPTPFGRALPPGMFGPAAPSMRQVADIAAMTARNAAPAAVTAEQAAVNGVRAAMAAGGGGGAAPPVAAAAAPAAGGGGWLPRMAQIARSPAGRVAGRAAIALPLAMEAFFPDDAERAARAQDARGVREAWGRSAAEGAGAVLGTAARMGGRAGYNAFVAPVAEMGGAFVRGAFGLERSTPASPRPTTPPVPPSTLPDVPVYVSGRDAPIFGGLSRPQIDSALAGLPGRAALAMMGQAMQRPTPRAPTGRDQIATYVGNQLAREMAALEERAGSLPPAEFQQARNSILDRMITALGGNPTNSEVAEAMRAAQ